MVEDNFGKQTPFLVSEPSARLYNGWYSVIAKYRVVVFGPCNIISNPPNTFVLNAKNKADNLLILLLLLCELLIMILENYICVSCTICDYVNVNINVNIDTSPF